jgi:F0F1-type ATP synthase membrane subunit a
LVGKNYFGVFKKLFLSGLVSVFGYEKKMILSTFLSRLIFLLLLILCFLGYFSYSFCICGIIEFTFSFALVSWLRTFLVFIRGERFSVYMRKMGDSYLKTLSIFLVELVREFSRPVALTVRLTVNILVGHLIRIIIYTFLELTGGLGYN